MAAVEPVKTSWQWQHELIEAAQERGWEVAAFDGHAGRLTLEEPGSHGIVLVVSGRMLTSAFIRSLPEARGPVSA